MFRSAAGLIRAVAVLGALVGTLACSLISSPTIGEESASVDPSGAPVVEIASPLQGATYREGVGVNIMALVTNAGADIARVEILVDDTIIAERPSPNPSGSPAFSVAQTWPAETTGALTVAVTVFRGDGSSASNSTSINVVGENEPQTALTSGGESENAAAEPAEEAAPPPSPTPQPEEPAEEAAPPPAEEAPPEDEAPPEEPSPQPTSSSPQATFTIGANIRGGPSTDFARIGSYAEGTTTDLLGVTTAGDWYKIQYYNGEGWVASNLVTTSGNTASLPIDDGPPPPTPTFTPIPPTDPPPQRQTNMIFDGNTGVVPFPPRCGQTMTFTIRIRNIGEEGFGSTSAVVIRDVHIDSGAVSETVAPLPDLGPGERSEIGDIFLTVDTNVESRHRIEIQLDANNEIEETNEDDNFFSGLEYTLEGSDEC